MSLVSSVSQIKNSNAGNRTRGSNVKGLNVTDYTTLESSHLCVVCIGVNVVYVMMRCVEWLSSSSRAKRSGQPDSNQRPKEIH